MAASAPPVERAAAGLRSVEGTPAQPGVRPALALLIAGCGLALGVVTQAHGILTSEGALRALRATQVWFAWQPSLRSLGYDLSPLPTLLELPLVLLPPLRSNPLAGVVVASLAGVLLAWNGFLALRSLGLGRGLATALTATVLLHPLLLYGVATGAGDVLGAALLMLAVRLVLEWLRDQERSLPLIGAAFAVGLAALARYDLLGPAVALTVLVGVLSGRDPGKQLAYGIAFGTPAASTFGLWLVLNWLATGDALTFAAQHAAALARPGSTLHTDGNVGATLAPFILMAPAALIGLLGACLAGAAGRRADGRPVLVLTCVLLSVALAAAAGSLLSGTPLGLLAGLPLVPLSVVLLAAAAAALELRFAAPLLIGLAAAGAVLPVLSMAARDNEPGQGYAGFVAGLTGSPATPMWSSEQALATTLRAASVGRDILLDDRRDAVVALLVGEPEHLIATADQDYGPAVSDPRGRARLIVVHDPGPADQPPLDLVNAMWPRLYRDGAAWARFVGEWPVSGDRLGRYRVYRVLDATG